MIFCVGMSVGVVICLCGAVQVFFACSVIMLVRICGCQVRAYLIFCCVARLECVGELCGCGFVLG